MVGRVDRRGFLAALGGAGLAPAARGGRTGKRTIRKAVKLGMVEVEAPLLERFRLLRELGFDGVELASPNDLDRAEVLDARDASGLPIHGVVDSAHWQHTLGDPDADVRAQGRAALETAIDDCDAYGGTTVLLVPAVVGPTIPYDRAWERSHAEIARVLPRAEEAGVAIAFENVWNHFLLSPLEAARWVDSFESPAVGWYLDVGNLVTYGWPEQWVRILGERILKLDVKEFSRAKRDAEGLWKGFDAEIGDGDCNWPAVMTALDEVGYAGWATAEVRGGGPEWLREIGERMDRVLGK